MKHNTKHEGNLFIPRQRPKQAEPLSLDELLNRLFKDCPCSNDDPMNIVKKHLASKKQDRRQVAKSLGDLALGYTQYYLQLLEMLSGRMAKDEELDPSIVDNPRFARLSLQVVDMSQKAHIDSQRLLKQVESLQAEGGEARPTVKLLRDLATSAQKMKQWAQAVEGGLHDYATTILNPNTRIHLIPSEDTTPS